MKTINDVYVAFKDLLQAQSDNISNLDDRYLIIMYHGGSLATNVDTFKHNRELYPNKALVLHKEMLLIQQPDDTVINLNIETIVSMYISEHWR